MDERRKQAYRYLLYYAMLDIRPLAWMPFGFFRFLNPFSWRTTSWRVRRAGVIADWLHNLALFSALDFQRFDEKWFWRDLGNCADMHPDLELTAYKGVFERELSGEGHIRDGNGV
jgi:hypothetical protein